MLGMSVFNVNNFHLKLNDCRVEFSDSIAQLFEYSRIPFIMMGDTLEEIMPFKEDENSGNGQYGFLMLLIKQQFCWDG